MVDKMTGLCRLVLFSCLAWTCHGFTGCSLLTSLSRPLSLLFSSVTNRQMRELLCQVFVVSALVSVSSRLSLSYSLSLSLSLSPFLSLSLLHNLPGYVYKGLFFVSDC